MAEAVSKSTPYNLEYEHRAAVAIAALTAHVVEALALLDDANTATLRTDSFTEGAKLAKRADNVDTPGWSASGALACAGDHLRATLESLSGASTAILGGLAPRKA